VYLVHVGGDDLCAVRYNRDVLLYITCMRSCILGLKKNMFYVFVFSGVPRNFVLGGGGGSTNSVEDRENEDLGAVAP